MNVVDSCGWLEYFARGLNTAFFAPAVEATDGSLVVPAICIYEVVKNILGQFTRPEALKKIALMTQAVVVLMDEPLAIEAAVISRELKLPMGDSIILATARSRKATLWTQDAHFEHIEGVQYCPKLLS